MRSLAWATGLALTVTVGCDRAPARDPHAQPAPPAASPAAPATAPPSANSAAANSPPAAAHSPPAANSPTANSPPATAKAPPAPADVAAPPADAERDRKSGLAWKVLRPGTGTRRPRPWDRVTLRYTGWTRDGKFVDDWTRFGAPPTFALDDAGLAAPWIDAAQKLVVGEQARFWIPGNDGPPLVFDLELLALADGVAPPRDLARPPRAPRGPSGAVWKLLRRGPAAPPLAADATVRAHLTSWTRAGKLTNDTRAHGTPAAFALDDANVDAGLREAVATMRPGDVARVWSQSGARLVYDVELLQIVQPRY